MIKNSTSPLPPVPFTLIEQVRNCLSDFWLAISFFQAFFFISPVRTRTVLTALLLGFAAFSSIPQSAAGVQMIVSKSSVDTREGFKPTLDVELSEEPSADVVVTAMSSDTDKLTVSPASLTIKPGQHPEGEDNDPLNTGICYFSPPPPPPNCPLNDPACKADHSCYFEITLRQDPDSDDNTITITLSATGLTSKTVDVSVLDDDGDLMLELPQAPVMVPEGSTTDFGVYPDFQLPRGKEITVNVVSEKPDKVTVMHPAYLTFTHDNFFDRHTVTVKGEQDPDANDEMVTLTLSGMGVTTGTVTVKVHDDEAEELILPQLVTVTEGSEADFHVALNFEPPGNVTVNVMSEDTDKVDVLSAPLVFTPSNWDTPQQVTVKGEQDLDATDERVTLTLSGMGVTTGTVTVEVHDDEAEGLILPQLVTVTEGSEADFHVALNFEPPGNVTVNVMSEDTDKVDVLSAPLVFTPSNWDTPQQVIVMGIQDPDVNDETVALTLSGAGVTTRTVTVEVSDNTIITRGPVVNLPGAPCDTQDNESIAEEREALAQLYGTAGGENWVNGDNWGDISEPVDNWYGVMTNDARRVRELTLGANGLAGELPDELENLDCLENLDVSDNSDLEGELPLGLMDLSKLMTLHINGTDLCAPEERVFLEWLRDIKTLPENVDVCVADEEDDISGDGSAGGGCAVASYAQTGSGGMSAAFGLFLTALVLLAAVSPKRRPGAGTAGFQTGIGQQ